MNKESLTILYKKGIIENIDVYFGRFMATLSGTESPFLLLAAALVSNTTGKGNVCLDLSSWAERLLIEKENNQDAIICPKLPEWRETLLSIPLVGRPGDHFPLILDENDRLYLYRYWEYEKELSDSILRRITGDIPDVDSVLLRDGLNRLFPDEEQSGVNWQKIAALACTFSGFCVITGGPGTGKTTAVAKILALFLEQAEGENFRILLSAPTGKAAAKLSESIKNTKKKLDCREVIKDSIPQETYTIHRMLKPVRGSPYFRHNPENPLPTDLVVVDEASMVDIALMSKLVQATPDSARLVLLGDRDQLASVEAGYILGDICDRDNLQEFSREFCQRVEATVGESLDSHINQCKENPGLYDAIVHLKQSYRFAEQSEIGRLSRAINRGSTQEALDVLRKAGDRTLRWVEMRSPKDLYSALEQSIVQGYRPYLEAEDPHLSIERFQQFIVLNAVNFGPFGVDAVNALARQVLSRAGLINTEETWYRGRPVLITRNDYDLGLYNGDIGITLPMPDSGSTELHVFFPGTSGELRWFRPHRLPEHRTVYAMTIHKSQGSEFENVLIILPDRHYPVLTRELVYTGITRAKKSVSIWGSEAVLSAAISRKTERTSGLRDALWKS
ncbi:exodeoxyribonuclease V subunit alpha [Thermodesulfobacteriota bacterium]